MHTKWIWRLSFAIVALTEIFCLSGTPAWAQTTSVSAQSQASTTQSVPAPASSAPKELSTIVVTGYPLQVQDMNKLSASPTASPANVTEIGQPQLKVRPVNTYGDIFLPVAGFAVANYGQGGLSYGLALRGFTGNEHGRDLAIFTDGLPINQYSNLQANGYADLEPLISQTIERVEIIRGPFSPFYGNGAFGGAVNIETANDLPSSISLSGGSYGTGNILGVVSGHLTDKVNAYSADQIYNTDGYRDNSNLRSYNSFNKISFPLFAGTGSLRLQLFDDHSGEPGYLDEAAIKAGTLSPTAAINPTDGGTEQQQNLVFNYRGNDPENSWTADIYGLHDYFLRIRTFHGTQKSDGEKLTTYGGAGRRTLPLDLFGAPALFTAGVSFRGDHIIAREFVDNGEQIPVTQTIDRNIDLYNPAVFAELQVKPTSRLKLTLGARYDRYSYRIDSGVKDATPGIHISPSLSIFNPKAGLAIELMQGVELYANAARGYKAPSGLDELISNPNLNASRLTSYEIGIQDYAPSGRYSLKADVYRTDESNEVQTNPVSLQLENFGKTRRIGADIEGHYYFNSKLSIFANYSPVNPRLQDAPPGQIYVTDVPVYTATAGADYGFGYGAQQFVLSLFDKYSGPRYLNESGSIRSHTYSQIYTQLNYKNQGWKNFSAFVSAAYFPGSRLDEESFFSAGKVVTSPVARVTLNAGVTVDF